MWDFWTKLDTTQKIALWAIIVPVAATAVGAIIKRLWPKKKDKSNPPNRNDSQTIDHTKIIAGRDVTITYNKGVDSTDNGTWRVFQVFGSSFLLRSGIASTIREMNGCSAGWFSGESTVILGLGEMQGKSVNRETVASWKVVVEPHCLQHFIEGFLVIGCLRFFGGLHSKHYGAKVEVLLNNKHIDEFGLMTIPQDHTDYFHRIPLPKKLPDIWPLTACQTTYAWSIQKANFTAMSEQIVKVRIDKQVSWDIDYVAIVALC